MNAPLSHDCKDAPDICAADLRLLGLGLNDCERALLDCTPAVCHDRTFAKLFGLGISGDGMNGRGPFDALAVAPVCFLPGGRFEFSSDMRDATGCKVAIIISAFDQFGDLADLAALDMDSGALAAWRGVVAMLGEEHVFAPRVDEPLIVHETVFDWLRAGRNGVVILDAARAAPMLHLAPPIGVTSAVFGRRLRRALTVRAPRIVVAFQERRVA